MRWAHKRVMSFLKIQVVNGTGDNPYVQVAQGNVTIVLPKGGSGAMNYGREWDPTKTYKAFTIVKFNPEGESAGMYISLQDVAAGVSPDTGAPNWDAFTNAPPGVWA